jgi:integrase
MAHIEDRWWRTIRQPDGSARRERTERYEVGRRWRVRYADPGGRERSRSFKRRADAEKYMVDVAADVQRGTYTDPASGKITLRRYGEGWLAAQTSDQATRDNAERRLRLHVYPVLGDKTLGQLAGSPSTVQAWVRGLKLAPTTAGGVLALLSSVLGAAVDDGLISRNPCRARSVRAPSAPRRKIVPWSASQADAVRDALPARYQALADVGRGLGLRQGEAFGLSADDIDFLRRVVHIRRQVKRLGNKLVFAPPKRGKDRDVPLPGSVGMRLSAHIASFPPEDVTLPWLVATAQPVTVRLLFTTVAGHAISRTPFVAKSWHPALRRAGVPVTRENGFHALRHHFASVLLHEGVDIAALASYLGHQDPGFTLRTYVHLMPDAADRMRSVIDKAITAASDGPATTQEAVQ